MFLQNISIHLYNHAKPQSTRMQQIYKVRLRMNQIKRLLHSTTLDTKPILTLLQQPVKI